MLDPRSRAARAKGRPAEGRKPRAPRPLAAQCAPSRGNNQLLFPQFLSPAPFDFISGNARPGHARARGRPLGEGTDDRGWQEKVSGGRGAGDARAENQRAT